MKKGTIVARKRFLQKYGNKIINGILIFSIIVFVSTLIVTNVAKAKPDTNIDSDGDGKPIGIILCAEKDNIMLEYALGGLSNNIFASTYTYYIPDKEELINEVEKVLNENN